MGGSSSKATAPPPVIAEGNYPDLPARVNTNLSTASAQQCNGCMLAVDTGVTTSSVTLTRDYGNVSNDECKQYQKDKDAVAKKELSFGDFLRGLAAGTYTRPVSQTNNGEFCEQILIDDEMIAKLTDYDAFLKHEPEIKGVRIRKVTGGGSFFSGSKVKIVLSLPLRAQYVSGLKDGVPDYKDITIRTMTLYHPSPIRVENVQHDAVLSLNDPSDEVKGDDTVILIPLKGSNTGAASETFFNKIVKHAISLSAPSMSTGMFEKVDVPTGADWNLKDLFWLDKTPTKDGFSKVLDAYYSWDGLPTFNRKEVSRQKWNETGIRIWEDVYGDQTYKINFGWEKSSSAVRYFMLANPVNIAMSDLSILTRNLPPTPPEQAIHKIPDAAMNTHLKNWPKQAPPPAGWPAAPIVYKAAEGDAIAGACCGGVERTVPTEEEPKDLPAFGKESFADYGNTGSISPNQIITVVFGFITVIFMMIGAAIALHLISRDYDYGLRSASNSVGEAVGAWFAKIAGRIKAIRNAISAAKASVSGEGDGGEMDLSSLKGLGQGKLGDMLGSVKGNAEGKLGDLLGSVKGNAEGKLGSLGDVSQFKQMLGGPSGGIEGFGKLNASSDTVKNLAGSVGSLLKGFKK